MHDAIHSPWPSGPKDIELVGDGPYTVVTRWYSWRHLLRMKSSTGPTI